MKIPTKQITFIHKADKNDISWLIWKSSENKRLQATNKIVEKMAEMLPLGYDFITSGVNAHSVRLGIALSDFTNGQMPFIYPTAISQEKMGEKLLKDSRIVLVADTVENARTAYARLLEQFPLKIEVLAFLG